MILTVDEENGGIFNEDGIKVGVLTAEGNTPMVKRTIEFGSEAAPALTKVIADVNSGSFKPRALVKALELIAEKYNNI